MMCIEWNNNDNNNDDESKNTINKEHEARDEIVCCTVH